MLPADIALANELVTFLAAEAHGRYWPERVWVPDWDARTELDTLQVAVFPSPTPTGELIERDQLWETWPIDFGFVQRLQVQVLEEIDALIGLVDEVRERLQVTEVTLDDGRIFQSIGFEFLARFDPSRLNRQLKDGQVVYAGLFLSVLRIPFRRID